jgi:MFS transporter, OFA family, oxalate/formate antiporter
VKRYAILSASILMQVCLGGIYAWSTFVPSLSARYGLSAAQTQLIFGVTIAMLTVSMVGAGRVEARRGPRIVAATGAVLYALGYLLAARSQGHFLLLLVGIGVIAGAGIGTAYICPISTCIKWFPERKGLITGLSVAGYGAGAIVLTQLSALLFGRGWDVLAIFRLVGLVYGGVVFLCALVLSVPRGTAAPAVSLAPVHGLGRQREFWGLAAGMFSATFAGTMVIGNLKPLGLHGGASLVMATAAISTLAVGNAAGRLTWGSIHDRLGSKVLPVSLLFIGAAVAGMLLVGHVANSLLVLSLLVGFGYGAALVLYAAQAAQVWGPAHVGRVYPMIMLFHGGAAMLGPALAGHIVDVTGSYGPALILAAAVAALGAVAVWRVGLTDHRDGVGEVEEEMAEVIDEGSVPV